MAADTLDARMARLEGAYEQITKRLDDLQGSVHEFRGEVHAEFRQFRGEVRAEFQQFRGEFQQFRGEFQQLRIEFRSQFWHFAALVLPLWLATAALLFRH